MKGNFSFFAVLVTCGLYLPASTASAGALYFPEMSSASESSYAGAGMVARANDAGTAFSNPAGMTRFKESEILAGATGVYIEANFKPDRDNTTVEGNDGSVNKRIVPAGSFAYVRPMSDRLWLGFSVHNYFGLAIDWKDDWVGRYSSTNVTVLAPQFQPSVGYKVNDWLSVGAGALSEIGVPQHEVPLALLMFNVGVETGQLLFIAAVLAVIALLKGIPVTLPEGAWRVAPYSIGGIAAFWTIERILSFLPGATFI